MVKTQQLSRAKILPAVPFPVEVAKELLATYGSPLYVYQGDRLRETIDHITQSIPYPRTQFHFASVVNGNIALLQIFKSCGWGLHANTPGDIYLGLKAGFAPSQIVYSGSNLSSDEMEQLLRWGITTLNLDSLAQMKLCCDIYKILSPDISSPRLGLRLNLPEITGDSRIGVRPDEFDAASGIANSAGLKLSGLHFYRGTGTNATKAFTQVIDKVIATAKLLPYWQYLDFGGGFGYPYHGNGVAFDWETFGKELFQSLKGIHQSVLGHPRYIIPRDSREANANKREIDLIIEPGRAAIASSCTLLAQVVSVKWQEGKQIVGVDTTVANLSVPSVHGGYREIVTWKQIDGERYPTDICGNTTYSRDYLGRNYLLPALEIGDIIAILDVGAYGYAMSSHFLHRPRPAEILLENGTCRLIRQREDYNILLTNQLFN